MISAISPVFEAKIATAQLAVSQPCFGIMVRQLPLSCRRVRPVIICLEVPLIFHSVNNAFRRDEKIFCMDLDTMGMS